MESFKHLGEFCPTQNNWILQTNYQQVIGHGNQQVSQVTQANKIERVDSLSEPTDLVHIFFNYMTGDHLVALVLTKAGQYVLINNKMEVEVETTQPEQAPEEQDTGEIIHADVGKTLPKIRGVSSQLTIITRSEDLLNRELLSGALQKTIGLKRWSGQKKSSGGGAKGLDYASFFGHYKLKSLLPLVYQWIKESGKVLDFTNQYYINERQLDKLPDMGTVDTIKLNQNCQIGTFDWLRHFPNLEHLQLDQCQQVNNDVFSEICRACPRLKSVTIKFCCALNIRIMLDLLKLDRLDQITVDFPNFNCQKSAKEVLISRAEWRSQHSYSLQTLFINSENMTLDVLDYMFKACPELKNVYLNDDFLKSVSKNVMFNPDEMREDNTVNFHSSTDFRRGFRACRPMTFKNMFKNYMTAPFSKSMLDRIRQQETQDSEIQATVQELETN